MKEELIGKKVQISRNHQTGIGRVLEVFDKRIKIHCNIHDAPRVIKLGTTFFITLIKE